MENERIKIYQGLKADGETDLGFVDFKKKYFGSEQATSNFYQMLVSAQDPKGVFYYNDTIQNFFKKYACDLFPNSTYCGGSGSATTTPGTGVFACVESAHTSGKAYTSGKTQLHITRAGGIKHIFKNDNNFTYKLGTIYHFGTWACDGTNNYKITLKNGQTYSSKDQKWSPVPTGNTPTPTPAPTTGGGGATSTSLTAEDLKNGRFVKLGMKGDIIGKIQELLISKGYKDISKDGKVDKVFGGRTKRMVKSFQSANGLTDDGAVGPLTWGKLNDSSAVAASAATASSSTTTPEKIPVISGSDAVLF
jgi:hypothetical protein